MVGREKSREDAPTRHHMNTTTIALDRTILLIESSGALDLLIDVVSKLIICMRAYSRFFNRAPIGLRGGR